MKIHRFPLASTCLIGAILCCGCGRVSGDRPQASSPSADMHETQNMPSQREIETIVSANIPLSKCTRFSRMGQASENQTAYALASQLVKDLPPNAKLQTASKRFSNWFILTYLIQNDNNDLDIADATTPQRYTRLVDLERRKAIATGDFEAARPLLERLVEIAKTFDNPEETADFLNRIDDVIMTIAQNNQNNISDSDLIENHGIPQIADNPQNPKRTTITFYFTTSHGDMPAFERATFLLTEDAISFSHEPYAP